MVLEDVAATPKPDTKFRRSVGRPIVDQEAERLVLQMAVRCRERLGGPAEALREGSGIGVDGAAGPGEVTAYHVETYPVVGGLNALSLANTFSGFSSDRITAVIHILKLPATRISRSNFASARVLVPAANNSCVRLDGEYGTAYNGH